MWMDILAANPRARVADVLAEVATDLARDGGRRCGAPGVRRRRTKRPRPARTGIADILRRGQTAGSRQGPGQRHGSAPKAYEDRRRPHRPTSRARPGPGVFRPTAGVGGASNIEGRTDRALHRPRQAGLVQLTVRRPPQPPRPLTAALAWSAGWVDPAVSRSGGAARPRDPGPARGPSRDRGPGKPVGSGGGAPRPGKPWGEWHPGPSRPRPTPRSVHEEGLPLWEKSGDRRHRRPLPVRVSSSTSQGRSRPKLGMKLPRHRRASTARSTWVDAHPRPSTSPNPAARRRQTAPAKPAIRRGPTTRAGSPAIVVDGVGRPRRRSAPRRSPTRVSRRGGAVPEVADQDGSELQRRRRRRVRPTESWWEGRDIGTNRVPAGHRQDLP